MLDFPFVVVPGDTLPGVRFAALTHIATWSDAYAAQIKGTVSRTEEATWTHKAAVVGRYLAGDTTPGLLAALEMEAALAGKPTEELMGKVGAKSATFIAVGYLVSGLRQAAGNHLEVEAAVADAKAAFEAAVAALTTPPEPAPPEVAPEPDVPA